MNFDEVESERDDSLELLRICFIDIFQTSFSKIVLVITFFNVIALTLMQTYYSILYFDSVQFLKYSPIYFGRFYVLVSVSFILFYKNVIHKHYQDFSKWKINCVGKVVETEIKRESIRATRFSFLIILLGVGTATLYVVPSETDYETFFIMTWFKEHVPEWADVLSLMHRLSFLFVSFLMQTPCIQLYYIQKHIHFQTNIFIQFLGNLDSGYDNLDLGLVVFDGSYHEEIKKRLLLCVKRHIDFITFGNKFIKSVWLFIFLFSVSGGLLAISLLMFFIVLEDLPVFMYVRLCSLVLVAAVTGILYISQGQCVENIAGQLSKVLCTCNWYRWNEQNRRIYLMFLRNTTKPFKIKFSDKISVNYKLGLDIVKVIYSVLSLLVHVTDSVVKN